MNRTEFIKYMAEQNGCNFSEAERMLNAVLGSIENALVEDRRIKLTGFGTFEVKERKARIGRNPNNPSEEYAIHETLAPVFKAGSLLKKAVNIDETR